MYTYKTKLGKQDLECACMQVIFAQARRLYRKEETYIIYSISSVTIVAAVYKEEFIFSSFSENSPSLLLHLWLLPSQMEHVERS